MQERLAAYGTLSEGAAKVPPRGVPIHRGERSVPELVPKPKRLTREALLGQQGIALIESLVLEMGARWSPSGQMEVGIDGHIELFDNSGNALSQLLLVQSKAHEGSFNRETEASFDFPCSARDVEYWVRFNAPMLLVVSRPSTREAYWVSVQRYFADPKNRRSRTIRFDKASNRLTKESLPDLLGESAPPDAGVQLGPSPRDERLISNLLQIATLPKFIYVAETGHRKRQPIWDHFKRAGTRAGNRFLLKSKRIFGFEDLDEGCWPELCDAGTIEKFDTSEWSESSDPDRSREFAELLCQAVHEKLYPIAKYRRDLETFVWSAPKSGETQRVRYGSLKRDSKIAAFTKYSRKSKDRLFTVYRHMAFRGRFRRVDGDWCLEITPTYVFTYDGHHLDRFHAERLAGIKRLEGNRAVLSQVLFWADLLRREEELFESRDSMLSFGELKTIELPFGVEDSLWLKSDPEMQKVEEPADEAGLLFAHAM
jgi:hypothetical protein